VESEARLLKMHIDQMLKWSDSDRAVRHPFDLSAAINQAISAFKKESISEEVKINNLSSAKDIVLVGSVESFKAAIAGLFKNSAEAMLETSDKEIYIRVTKDADRIKLIIEDTGKGISSSQQDKVFDPFYTTKHGASDVGIGLTFGLSVAKSMGGRLFFEPKLPGVSGVGARFIFDLPITGAEIDVKPLQHIETSKYETPTVPQSFSTKTYERIPDALPEENEVERFLAIPESESVLPLSAATASDPSAIETANSAAPTLELPSVEVAISENIEKLTEKIKFKVRAPKASINKEPSL
jgi:hypothetical protein